MFPCARPSPPCAPPLFEVLPAGLLAPPRTDAGLFERGELTDTSPDAVAKAHDHAEIAKRRVGSLGSDFPLIDAVGRADAGAGTSQDEKALPAPVSFKIPRVVPPPHEERVVTAGHVEL